MSDIIEYAPSVSSPIVLASARVPINVRPAVLGDIPFMDSLQKMHSKMVGFMPTAQFEGNIKAGRVLIAEEVGGGLGVGGGEDEANRQPTTNNPPPTTTNLHPTPVGYCLANDRYFKHDDVGIIYQMNVKPGRQRSLVGAMLLKAQFERSAYGCKLYCCWCAQDIAANRFWEAMGFVPLAFRTGSEKKSRIHIFWQKRIRSGDTITAWWFPSETSGGAVRANRIVLPIPPGTHWRDAKPLVLPALSAAEGPASIIEENIKTPRVKKPVAAPIRPIRPINKNCISMGGLWFAPVVPPEAVKPKKQPKPKTVNDPRLVAAARELRDRWLEQVNEKPLIGCGKYDVSRAIGVDTTIEIEPMKLLEAA